MATAVMADLKPHDAFDLQPYRNLSLGTTGVVVKATAGHVYGWHISNSGAAAAFVRLYDKTAAPLATDPPDFTLLIPAGGVVALSVPQGLAFQSGIGLRASTGVADSDTGAPAANQVIANLWYS